MDDQASSQAVTRDCLIIRWPDGTIKRYPLEADVTRIGRHPDKNDIVVPPDLTTISSTHAEIRRVGDAYQVFDLSANGTVVNGVRIQEPTPLDNDDEIRIGDPSLVHEVRMVVRLPAAAPADVHPAPGAPPPQADYPSLAVRWHSGEETTFTIDRPEVLLGRSPEADFIFPRSLWFVSNRHFTIRREGAGYVIADLESTNGTRVNNRLLVPNEPAPLKDGDVIRIGDEDFGAWVGLVFHDPAAQAMPGRGFTATDEVLALAPAKRLSIGRDPASDIVLETSSVSRHHAVIEPVDGGHRIRDLQTLNGTYLNGQRIDQAMINAGDIVQIGPHVLAYDGWTLSRFDSQGMRMDVVDVYKEVRTPGGPLRILDDISMTVMPREFVALVGGSGAGKSTLMDALNGFRPASGHILLNNNDFYRNYDNYRTQLGYVPQHDILHNTLTVERALNFTARLRLPPDVTAAERKERIAQVLETVGMNSSKIYQTRISNLSGGQRKRVSIAAELLAEPKLFFLDEPTSGLDPGLEKKMMYTMRQMADEGRTILLITHATNNIVQADHVAFLSQGKLVYFGPPQQALDYFEVGEFADIYEKIERYGDEWRETFTQGKPDHYQHYVLQRQQTRQAIPAARAAARRGFDPLQSLGQAARQFGVLVQRMLSIIFGERLTLGVLLAIMPLIAVFLVMVARGDVLVGDPDIIADPQAAAETLAENYLPTGDAQIMLFAMSLAAVLFGLFASSNELVGERSIYLRERMVNLKLPPYIFSKLFVYALFAGVSSLVFLVALALKIRFPVWGALLPGALEFFLTIFLATMVSVAMGLLLSSIASSSNMVSYMILIVLFVQIIFSGAIFDLRGNIFEPVSYLTVTRWTLVGLGTTNDMNGLGEAAIVCGNAIELVEDSVQIDPATQSIDFDAVEFEETDEPACTNKPVEPEDLTVHYGDGFLSLAGVWLVLAIFGAVFTAATFVMVRRLDRT